MIDVLVYLDTQFPRIQNNYFTYTINNIINEGYIMIKCADNQT